MVRPEQVGPPDRADQDRPPAEQQARVVRDGPVGHPVRHVLGRVARRVEHLEAQAPDVEAGPAGQAGVLVAELGTGADDMGRAGQGREVASARDVVVVEVRLDDVADPQAAPGGDREVDVDVAPRIDDRGDPGVLVRDERGQVAQPADRERLEPHRYIITRPPSTASTWPVM